jgi:hypothetical protein
LLASLLFVLACRPPASAVPDSTSQVRFRPAPEPSSELAQELILRVPSATWDEGLARGCELLIQQAGEPSLRLTPASNASALGRAGYPGHARIGKELNGGAFPSTLVDEMVAYALSSELPVDVGLASRSFADGQTLWIGGIAPKAALVDPLPRRVDLDASLPITIEVLGEDPQELELVLYVASPHGPVEAYPMLDTVAQWMTTLNVPGEYRMEVVGNRPRDSQVLLLWTLLVDQDEPTLVPLGQPVSEPQSPMAAAEALYEELSLLRARHGLPELQRFPAFEPLAREHSALMASEGRVAHVLPGVTQGVMRRAGVGFHPRADHREDVAAAVTWRDAHDLVELSPGHKANLLCEDCTHVAIGVALEPVLDRQPRLFVTWELLKFPNGPPVKKEPYDH